MSALSRGELNATGAKAALAADRADTNLHAAEWTTNASHAAICAA